MATLRKLIPILLPILLFGCNRPDVKVAADNYIVNRKPLTENKFIELPLGAITADGWLKEMLLTQKDGATGHLDELYPEVVGSRNGWLGGDGDQWERGPYWIDGLLPLAYILNDSTLIAKTTPWIEWALASQRADGNFGPATDYPYERGLQRDNCQDWWPRMVVLKVLRQYYSATGDRRVIDLMDKYFRYQLKMLPSQPLDNWTFWARFRGCDNMSVVYWLYNITGEKYLLDLADILYAQSEPFTEIFLAHDKLRRMGTIHSVNLAQGLKTPIIYYQAHPDQKYIDAVDAAIDDLTAFHGYPVGTFSGDEAIHGNDPTQGTELCTIVEYMFSLEEMYKITGNPRFAEILEKIAYNALPTQVDDAFMNRQYFQQVNQIALVDTPHNFDVNHSGMDACFGLLTGYPCCTSNMHQGWPKFVQNLWYATPLGGIAVTQYAPSQVKMKVVGGDDIVITEHTDYPFKESVAFTIDRLAQPSAFDFCLRIPSWSTATTIAVNGEPVAFTTDADNMATINREWTVGDELSVAFTAEIRSTVWKENSRAIERGPLVYALKMREKSVLSNSGDKEQGKKFYVTTSNDNWNYALTSTPESADNYKFTTVDTVADYPWNVASAPLSIRTTARRLAVWKEYNHSAGPLPYSISFNPVLSSGEEEIELIPYGCTTLRITELPLLGQHSAE